jgi:phage terminase large subunit-like protein
MRPGRKADPLSLPLDLAGLPRTGAARVVAFLERYVQTTKGKGARKPLRVRPWQRQLIGGVFNAPRPRAALWSMPRGQGKSTLAAGLGLYGLFADRVEGASVVVVASDERQARIVWGTAVRMVELESRLEDRVQTYHDRLYIPRTGSSFQVLPAEPRGLEGLDPSLAIVDEIGVVDRRTYEAVAGATGKRRGSLLLMIGTPSPDGSESVMWELVEHARDHPDDKSFRLVEFAAPAGCDLDDEDAWAVAMPALDDFCYRDGVRATLPPKLRESTFRRYRLGQWIDAVDEPWLPAELWAACTHVRGVPDGTEVVIGLDGSFSGDCTALTVCEAGETPHLDVVGLWANPNPGDESYRVPVVEVEDTIRAACKRWRVSEVVADPFRWTRTLQVLQDERIATVEFPQSPSRMTPATSSLYEAVTNHAVTHSGDARLAKHVANCVLKADSRGTRLVKEHKHSRRHIDLAVAAVMAHDRARALASRPKAAIYVLDG